MTTTRSAPRTDAAPPLALRAALVLAPVGPLAIAGLRAVLPYSTVDEPATAVEKIMAAPAAAGATLWLFLLALLTLPLGVLVTGRLAMRARPVLGTVAAVVAWIGFTSLFAVTFPERLALAAPTAGVDPATVAALAVAVDAHPTASVAVATYVAGHIVGGVLLGVALWGVVPRWAALALIVSQPLHLVFAVIAPNPALDAAAWTLTGVGFAAAAWTTLRRAV